MKKTFLTLGSLLFVLFAVAGCNGEQLQGRFGTQNPLQVGDKDFNPTVLSEDFDVAVSRLRVGSDGQFVAEFVNQSKESSQKPLRMELLVDNKVVAQQEVVFAAGEEAMLLSPSFGPGTYGVSACIDFVETQSAPLKDAMPSNNCKLLSLQVGP